jgi:hypothetical protein
MPDDEQAILNAELASGEPEVPDDPVDAFEDDPPPPFSDRPPEAVVDDSVGDDEEPIDPTEDAVEARADELR